MKPYYINVVTGTKCSGLLASVMRDVIAINSVANTYNRELCVCTANSDIRKNIKGMGYEVSNSLKGKICLLYKTEEDWPDVPDEQKLIVERDLFQKKRNNNLLLDSKGQGYTLKDPVRYSFSNLSRIYNHPNGFAPPDAAMIMMWGPVKA